MSACKEKSVGSCGRCGPHHAGGAASGAALSAANGSLGAACGCLPAAVLMAEVTNLFACGSALGVVAHDWFGEGAGVPLFDAPAATAGEQRDPVAVGEAAEGGPVGFGDAQEEADADAGGETVGGDDDGVFGSALVGDAGQRGGEAGGDLSDGFAGGAAALGFAGADAGGGFGIHGGELGHGQAGPVVDVDFPQRFVVLDLQSGEQRQLTGGGRGALEVAGEQTSRRERGEASRGGAGLVDADGVQRDVGLTLDLVLQVPLRPAMTPDDEPSRGHSADAEAEPDAPAPGRPEPVTAPPGTGDGSGMAGQSRQRR